jgi:hypothetical protein
MENMMEELQNQAKSERITLEKYHDEEKLCFEEKEKSLNTEIFVLKT